jgi:solute:Na+ symporter, SSS family
VVLAIVMVPHYFKGEIYSPYQLLEGAFGQSARKFAGALFLVSETLGAGVRVYVASIPLNLMLGEKVLSFGTGEPILGAIFIFVIVSLVYTYIGGVKAVIWTDAVQFFLFLGGGLFTLFYIPTLIEGGFSAAMETARAGAKLEWFNGEFSLAMPFNIWMGVIGATFVVLSSHGAEQLIVQRVLACKNVVEGRKALILSAVIIFPMFLMFLLIGAFLWAYYQTHARPMPEITANDYIYPIFMVTAVPHVLKGFLIVAILAAAMSSVSSTLNALASVSTMDFVKAMTGGAKSEEYYLRFSKWSTVFWAGALIVVAFLSRKVEYVLNAAFALRGLTSGALLGALFLVLFWKRGRALPVLVGMTGSFIAMIFVSRYEWVVAQVPTVQTAKVAWPWYTLIGTMICVGLAWATRAVMGRRPAVAAETSAS